MTYVILQEKFEDTKGEIRSSNSRGKLILLLHVCSSCYFCYKPLVISREWGQDCDYNKRNIPVVIYDTDTP